MVGQLDAKYAREAPGVLDDIARLRGSQEIAEPLAERATQLAKKVLSRVTIGQTERTLAVRAGSEAARAGLQGAAEFGLESGAIAAADLVVPGGGAALESTIGLRGAVSAPYAMIYTLPFIDIKDGANYPRPPLPAAEDWMSDQ